MPPIASNPAVLHAVVWRFILASGAAGILAALLVDFAGIGGPGFSPTQIRFLAFGTELILAGCVLRALRRSSPAGHAICRLLDPGRRPDLVLAAAIFVSGMAAASIYAFAVVPPAAGTFYRPNETFLPPQGIGLRCLVYGVPYGVSLTLAYWIFRTGMGRILSVFLTAALLVSPFHLTHLVPSPLRDYAKAPFILALILVMVRGMVCRPGSGRLMMGSVFAGAVLGTGAIVRQDLLVMAPPFAVVWLFFLPGPLRFRFRTRLAALGLFVFMLSPPLLLRAGSSAWAAHRALAGGMTPLDDALGVTRPAYDGGHLFLDEYVWCIVYAQVGRDRPGEEFACEPAEYDRLGKIHCLRWVRHTPADVLIRAYASVRKILDLPFAYAEPPPGMDVPAVRALYDIRRAVLRPLAGTGVGAAAAALVLVCFRSRRLAAGILFLILYLGGYPAVQFQGRHFFHLEILGWWTAGVILQAFGAILFRRGPVLHMGAGAVRGGSAAVLKFTVFATVVLYVPLAAARMYQSRHLAGFLRGLTEASVERLPLVDEPGPGGGVLRTVAGVRGLPISRSISAEFWMAEFAGVEEGIPVVWPVFRYETSPDALRMDFSRTLRVNLAPDGAGSTRVIFPAMVCREEVDLRRSPTLVDIRGSSFFKGIEMPPGQEACLRGLFRLREPSPVPLLLTAVLAPDWEKRPLYQQFDNGKADAEDDGRPDEPVVSGPESYRPIRSEDLELLAGIVRPHGDGWRIRGLATSPPDPFDFPHRHRDASLLSAAMSVDIAVGRVDTDLLKTRAVRFRKGDRIVVQGTLHCGGVRLGLVREGWPVEGMVLARAGPFRVVLKAPVEGRYWFGLANHLDLYTSREQDVEVDRMAWSVGD